MGLDISHLQLSFTPDEENNFFRTEDWDLDCNVPLKHYSKYITTIEDFDFNKSIAIVKNEEDLEKLKAIDFFREESYIKVFIGEINESFKTQLSKYLEKEKLDQLEKVSLGCETEGLKYHTISFGEPIKIQGVYYTDYIGYQRKGMSKLFYDTFEKYMLWGNKEDFDLAYTCVADEWYVEHFGENKVHDMRRNFKENFVDKFEFGKSLLCATF